MVERYLSSSAESAFDEESADSSSVFISKLRLSKPVIAPGEKLHVEFVLNVGKPLPNAHVAIVIRRLEGLHAAGVDAAGSETALENPGCWRFSGDLGAVDVVDGSYWVLVTVVEEYTGVRLTHAQASVNLTVASAATIGSTGSFISTPIGTFSRKLTAVDQHDQCRRIRSLPTRDERSHGRSGHPLPQLRAFPRRRHQERSRSEPPGRHRLGHRRRLDGRHALGGGEIRRSGRLPSDRFRKPIGPRNAGARRSTPTWSYSSTPTTESRRASSSGVSRNARRLDAPFRLHPLPPVRRIGRGPTRRGITTGRTRPGELHRSDHAPPTPQVALNGYDESLRIGLEDWDLYLTLAEQGIEGVLVDEPLFLYRIHGDGVTWRLRRTAPTSGRSPLAVGRETPEALHPFSRSNAGAEDLRHAVHRHRREIPVGPSFATTWPARKRPGSAKVIGER